MRIGVDAGGTFTDFVAVHDDGRMETFKLRSNPQSPASVILEGLRRIAPKADVVHGSTVATNALLERKGARTAFVTTAGFEDVLEIGRQNRMALYDLTPPPKRVPVERALRFGVAERMHFDGVVAKQPTSTELKRLAARLRAKRVESVAICFLHAYRNPANERAVATALSEELGASVYVCASNEISPEFREYERSSTTFVNAYVGPLMERYLKELASSRSYRISIMQSNGGFLSSKEASRHAVRTVLSGPAGGVVGAVETSRRSGFNRVLGFDMGGTSTDVCLADGATREATESILDGLPIRVPMLDIQTVGAGGGSIARVDSGGLLRVGPESAGADPGPACYGVGTEATVTDAHVVLGRISAEQLLGGAMHIDVGRSGTAVDRIARELKLDRVRAAAGIIRVANANMERAIRAVSVERGYDPRDFALVAFGGGGGLHACEIAGELGIRTVIVPGNAGVLSALGMLLADGVRDYAAGVLGCVDLAGAFDRLLSRARRESPGAALESSADLRYQGQSYELNVPWNPRNPAAAFHREHAMLYGYSTPEREVEIVTIRVRARRTFPKPKLQREKRRAGTIDMRRVWAGSSWKEVPTVHRKQVSERAAAGPALVLDYGSTTLVGDGWSYRVDTAGNLVIDWGDDCTRRG
ncbi:MAG: hydantoinase/oxoprolinase family protein [Bryobacteraceae bacterium]